MERQDIEKMQEIEDRCKSNTKRLDDHDRKLEELSDVYVALTKVNDKVDKVEENVSEMRIDIKEIKDKPKKRMDQLWGYIASALVGGIIGYILLKLGLK